MTAYLLKRLLIGILTLLFASVVVFAVLEVVPGDPARLMLGMNATEDAVQALREQMGLNQPLLTRYVTWLADFASGDFGRSLTYSVPVIDLVAERLVNGFVLREFLTLEFLESLRLVQVVESRPVAFVVRHVHSNLSWLLVAISSGTWRTPNHPFL